MKTIIVTIAAALISLNAAAYNPGNDPDKYCVTSKNGKTVVEFKGKPITKEITLKEGAKLKTDGTVVMADGSTVKLKDGECINKDNISDVLKRKEKGEGTRESEGEMPEDKKSGEKDWESKDYNADPERAKDMDSKSKDNKDFDTENPDRHKDVIDQDMNKDFDKKHPEHQDTLKKKRTLK
jgi:hypothetical protein